MPDAAERLAEIVNRVRKAGESGEYDCVLGLSGGIDSSFVAYQAKRLGLRPLGVHLDNGWDSELAVSNISRIVSMLGIDLFTYVVEWEEFRDLQRSFFMASVVDIEMLTDHAITALLYRVAKERRIKYILSGNNFVTEAVMPSRWKHRKSDLRNIRSIQRTFGAREIRSLPTAGTIRLEWYRLILGITPINLLNYLPYTKKEAIEVLKREVGWRPYAVKHGESIFTRFYQNYILPAKFNVDKRKAHFSTLICSGQMTRQEALKLLQDSPYDPVSLREEGDYVRKKLGFGYDEFDRYIASPPKSHYDYGSDKFWHDLILFVKRAIKELLLSPLLRQRATHQVR